MGDPRTFHLSVIISTASLSAGWTTPLIHSRKAKTERAVDSILSQQDAASVEIIVVDDSLNDALTDYLQSIWPGPVAQHQLKILRVPRSGDPGILKNEGARAAGGNWLTFLDYTHWWAAGSLPQVQDHLRQNDFLLTLRENQTADRYPIHLGSNDWLRAFIQENLGVPSSAWIRRDLFDRTGGFPEGYGGAPLPKKIPGDHEYEFWLRCLLALGPDGRRQRMDLSLPLGIRREDPTPQEKSRLKLQPVREMVSLMGLIRQFPAAYWPYVGKRAARIGKDMMT